MRVALVHDWLTGMRGGERVLEELCVLYPESTIFTLIHHPGAVSSRIESMPIRVSPINRIPAVRNRYRDWLPLYPWAISRFDLREFDLILSNSHAFAKGVRKRPESLHICSCLTPMRYIWDMGSDYFRDSGPFSVRRAGLSLLKHPLRAWDRATARQVDHFIANSRNVQQRIERHYGRQADVVYSPVDTGFFTPAADLESVDYFMVVSALVPYKRVDLAVETFTQSGRRLIVVGEGPERRKLERLAGPGVEFRGFVANEDLLELYRHCRAVIVTGLEDFGLVALEAQACGRPAIAFGAGGSLETVSNGETGILFAAQTAECLGEAIARFESTRFDPAVLRAHAERFSAEKFREGIRDIVQQQWEQFIGRVHPPRRETASASTTTPSRQIAAFESRHPSVYGFRGAAKRGMDIAFSLAGFVLLGPLLALVACLVRLGSAGPSIYRQKRLGLHGRQFTMVKLRTMRIGAEGGGAAWAVDGDPRCTPLGAWLRGYGIDELPQLWNVLKGEMSLVGPRPERPEFHEIFTRRFPGFDRRLSVRGGLTGLAQVRGWRGDTSISERLRSDLEYVDGWSAWKDLVILLRTPLNIFQKPGNGSPALADLQKGTQTLE